MKRFLALLLCCLLSANPAFAVVKICSIGDMQNLTLAEGEPAAWTRAVNAVTWAAAGDNCDVVIFTGDNVDGFYWGEDSWCLAQPGPGDPDCSEYHNDYLDFDCDTDGCGDANAATCTGATPGNFCEWGRAAYLVGIVKTANKPYIVLAGNHDLDKHGIVNFTRCQWSYSVFNSYFGKDNMSDDFVTSGYFEESTLCAEAVGGYSEQAIASYHLLEVDGFQLLFLNFPWFAYNYTASYSVSPYSGTTPGVVNFMKDVKRRFPKVPTIALTHTMGAEDSCADAAYEDRYFPWCNNLSGWDNYHTGMTIRREFLEKDPSFVATLGGHIRGIGVAVGRVPWKVFYSAHDYTDPITGAPSWQTNTDNGGGGVVTVIRVDPVSGIFSTLSYSPTDDDYVGIFDQAVGSVTNHHVGICSEKTRFDIPVGVCPEDTVSPKVCCR